MGLIIGSAPHFLSTYFIVQIKDIFNYKILVCQAIK